MKSTCSYIFKKGKNKGEKCTNEVAVSSLWCEKHKKPIPTLKKSIKVPSIEDSKKDKVLLLETSVDNKAVILKHIYNMKRVDSNSTEYYKNQIFVDLCLEYPWNKSFNIHDVLKNTDIKAFISYIKSCLDKEIYGMENVKGEILNILCKLVTNPHSDRNNIALHGLAGVGKSKFIKVLSQALGLPMKIISLGGIKDSSFFLGHGYVYVESGPGKILQNIIDCKISNPIIYFDELDKVSDTNGKDIHSFLSYLTDPTQNNTFTDHYFYGMKFDLSRVFYVFTFNDITKIDKVLLDRLNVIYVDTPDDDEIIDLLYHNCIPEIVKNIGIQHNIDFDKKFIKTIMCTMKPSIDHSVSSGIREYYRAIEKIFLEINKDVLLQNINAHNNTIYIKDDLFESYFNRIKNNKPQSSDTHLMMYI